MVDIIYYILLSILQYLIFPAQIPLLFFFLHSNLQQFLLFLDDLLLYFVHRYRLPYLNPDVIMLDLFLFI